MSIRIGVTRCPGCVRQNMALAKKAHKRNSDTINAVWFAFLLGRDFERLQIRVTDAEKMVLHSHNVKQALTQGEQKT